MTARSNLWMLPSPNMILFRNKPMVMMVSSWNSKSKHIVHRRCSCHLMMLSLLSLLTNWPLPLIQLPVHSAKNRLSGLKGLPRPSLCPQQLPRPSLSWTQARTQAPVTRQARPVPLRLIHQLIIQDLRQFHLLSLSWTQARTQAPVTRQARPVPLRLIHQLIIQDLRQFHLLSLSWTQALTQAPISRQAQALCQDPLTF